MAKLRQLQKEATRQLLLVTALEAFDSKGYAATTIDDIATAAGTTRATFYAHFDSRSDLMLALIGELNRILGRHDEPGRGSTASPLIEAVRDGSRAALGKWLRDQSAHWPEIRMYILAATEASAIDPDIRTLFNRWVEEVIADVKEGLDLADRFAPATRHFRGELAFASLDHTAIHWMREQWDLDADPALDVLTELWWKLVGDAGS